MTSWLALSDVGRFHSYRLSRLSLSAALFVHAALVGLRQAGSRGCSSGIEHCGLLDGNVVSAYDSNGVKRVLPLSML